MKYFALVLFIVSFSGWANPEHQVNYDPKTKQLNISTELCLYGRGIQTVLEETSYNNLNNYLRVQYKTIANSIAEQHNLKKRQREYVELLLTLKLNPDSLHHNFSIIGNDTCTEASAQFEVADSNDFTRLFEFFPPNTLYLTATKSELGRTLNNRLKAMGITNKPELFESHTTSLAQYKSNGQLEHLFQFDLKRYKKSLNQSTNTVHVSGEAPYKQLLEQYLQAKSFAIQSNPGSAYWQLAVKGELELQKFLMLSIDVKNQSNFETQVTNNSRKLPPSSLSNPIMLEKFFNVHLELMKFVQLLEDNK